MIKLDTKSIVYKECKRIADVIKGKRNLAQMDVAIIIARTVIGELAAEGWMQDEDIADLLTNDANKEFRTKLAVVVRPLVTAASNSQNGLMVDNELMNGNKQAITTEYLS